MPHIRRRNITWGARKIPRESACRWVLRGECSTHEGDREKISLRKPQCSYVQLEWGGWWEKWKLGGGLEKRKRGEKGNEKMKLELLLTKRHEKRGKMRVCVQSCDCCRERYIRMTPAWWNLSIIIVPSIEG